MVVESLVSVSIVEYYKDEAAFVYYDRDVDTLFLRHEKKVINDQQFVNINAAAWRAFRSLQTAKFVVDVRKMGMISINSQKWILDTFLPKMVFHLNDRKLLYVQLVDNKELLSKVCASNIANRARQISTKVEVIQFADEREMNAFLKIQA
jgi:hypothetical protein